MEVTILSDYLFLEYFPRYFDIQKFNLLQFPKNNSISIYHYVKY